MRFVVLSSGSKGNCLLVISGDTTVMVEAGLGPRVLKRRFDSVAIDVRSVSALVVTHGHSDHIARAPETAESLNIPTLASESCAVQQAAMGRPLFAHQAIVPGQATTVGRLTVTPFATPHDAPGSVGLVFQDDEARLGVLTDLGCATPAVIAALQDLDALYVEFNHDVPMLMQGTYPDRLKRRVRSNLGHLSNEQAEDLVLRTRSPRLRQLFLAHLSEHNNTPGLAIAAARRCVDGRNVEIAVAPQRHALRPVRVGRRGELKGIPLPTETARPHIPVNPPPAPELYEMYGMTTAKSTRLVAREQREHRDRVLAETLGGMAVGKGPAAQLSLFEAPVRVRAR